MQGEATPAWWVTPSAGPLDVNWQDEGDEWMHHLWTALGEEVELTGHGISPQDPFPEFPARHLVLVPTSARLTSRLRLIPLQRRGILAVITGTDSETADPTQVEPWLSAIEKASSRIGQRHRVFRWAAIIGERPNQAAQHRALASEATVDSLHLRPADHYLTEYFESWHQPSLHAASMFYSCPVIVEGETRGYSWPVALKAATRSVHRLAALLSLAWAGSWTLRHTPTPLEQDGRLDAPRQIWWHSQIADDHEPVGEFEREPAPDWLDQAWQVLDGDPAIEDALLVHHEGLILHEEGHASFAMVAFVSSIEAIGAMLGELRRCNECGTMIGSAERFRRALALVVPDEDRRKSLARAAYGQRSTTAHAGRLHGGEVAPGTFVHPSFFSKDEVMEFTMQLYAIRDASRDLLLRVLRDRVSLLQG